MEREISLITNNCLDNSKFNIKEMLVLMDKSLDVIVKGGQPPLSTMLNNKRPNLHTPDKLIALIEHIEKVHNEKPVNIDDYITKIPPVCLEHNSLSEVIQKANEALEHLEGIFKQLLDEIIKILRTYENN